MEKDIFREAKKEKLMLIENDNEKSIFKGRLMTVAATLHLTSFNITRQSSDVDIATVHSDNTRSLMEFPE
jgi:hypothetical protein